MAALIEVDLPLLEKGTVSYFWSLNFNLLRGSKSTDLCSWEIWFGKIVFVPHGQLCFPIASSFFC